MSVKVLHMIIFILMSALTSSLPLEAKTRFRREASSCKDCPAGTFMSSCNTCSPCHGNTFTDKVNQEHSCLHCFMDCRAELHMQVVRPCSSVSDVVCECMKGFVCIKNDSYTNQCKTCKQLPPPVQTTSQPPTQTFSNNVTQTPSYIWTNSQSTVDWVLRTAIPFLVILFIIMTFCFCKQRKIDCLKKRLKQCSVQKQKCSGLQEDSKAISSEINKPIKHFYAQESDKQSPSVTTSDCPTAQSASREHHLPGSGNLGPLHIYGAGTVFVSLLNRFGLNGGEKDEEDLRQQPLHNSEMQSPPSPTIPLSKEEWNRDISYISFPSQEQGKECHMSKEEGL